MGLKTQKRWMQKYFKYSTQKLTYPAPAKSSHGSLKTLDSVNHCRRFKRRRPNGREAKKLDKTGEPENVSEHVSGKKILKLSKANKKKPSSASGQVGS